MVTPSAENPIPLPRQSAVYRLYLALHRLAAQHSLDSLAGRLVLHPGFGPEGSELALATVIAGGTFLGIDGEIHRLKTAMRQGSCDFLVNTLDEALRVLKNEIRKHSPLSAGLLHAPATALVEMVERGVQPDLVAESHEVTLEPAGKQALEVMLARGAYRLQGSPNLQGTTIFWTAATPQDLRRMDQALLAALPPEDAVRRRWLQQASGYFHRQTPLQRVLHAQAEELPRLRQAWEEENASTAFQIPAGFQALSAEELAPG